MTSLNRCEFIGHLGRDPEVRQTQAGKAIVHLSLAVTDTWRDKNTGERRERTEWVRVVIFNEPLGEIAQKYLHKGSKIFIAGAMQTRKWTDQSGAEKYTTEIVLQAYRGEIIMLDTKSDGPTEDQYRAASDGSAQTADLDDDSEIPF